VLVRGYHAASYPEQLTKRFLVEVCFEFVHQRGFVLLFESGIGNSDVVSLQPEFNIIVNLTYSVSFVAFIMGLILGLAGRCAARTQQFLEARSRAAPIAAQTQHRPGCRR
jgi:hypothetical protein